MQELPEQAGIELANWNWRVVHRVCLGALLASAWAGAVA